MAYQIGTAANGTQIIAVAGLRDFTAGGLTANDIDNMIYSLYELTEDEIEMINK